MNIVGSHTSLQCPNCASTLGEDTWKLEEGIACCAYCRSIVSLPPHIRNFRRRPRLPLPSGLSIDQEAGGLTIVRRWFPVSNALGDFVMLGGGLCLLWWFGSSLLLDSPGHTPFVPVVALVSAGYFILAGLINRSWIRVSNGVLSITHGPLPWKGKVVLPCCEVDQLYAVEQFATHDHGPRATYSVCLATSDGRTRELLTGANLNREQVLYVEQQLEQAMGIDDRTVPGEIHRI